MIESSVNPPNESSVPFSNGQAGLERTADANGTSASPIDLPVTDDRSRMGYDTASKTDPESVIDDESDDMWFLKDELDSDHVGISVLELEPDGEGMEHDEADRGQEEIYYVVSGTAEVELTDRDETVTLEEDDAIRIDPEETRQIFNRSDERVKLVLVGAPL